MADSSRLAKLRSLIELPVLRQVSGALAGRHPSIFSGHGQDFDDLVDYQLGDDVSSIDWKTSARAGKPIIKRFQQESSLSVIMAVDTGRSMGTLAPSGETKEEIALATTEVLVYLALQRGDQVGLVSGDSKRLRQIPPRNGNSHAELILRQIAEDIALSAPPSDVPRLLNRVFNSVRRKSLLVIVTDQVNPPVNAEQILKKLRTKHEVMVVAVADANPTDFEAGIDLVDVDSGPLPDFLLTDDKLRKEVHAVSQSQQDQVKEMLRRRGIPVVSISNSQDVIPTLIDVLNWRKYA